MNNAIKADSGMENGVYMGKCKGIASGVEGIVFLAVAGDKVSEVDVVFF